MLLFYEQYDEDEKAFYIMTREVKGSWIKVKELLKKYENCENSGLKELVKVYRKCIVIRNALIEEGILK